MPSCSILGLEWPSFAFLRIRYDLTYVEMAWNGRYYMANNVQAIVEGQQSAMLHSPHVELLGPRCGGSV